MALKQASLFDLFDNTPEPQPEKEAVVPKKEEVAAIEKEAAIPEVENVADKAPEAIQTAIPDATIPEPEPEILDEKLLEENYVRQVFILEDEIAEDIVEFNITPAPHPIKAEKSVAEKERKSTRGRMKLSDMNTAADLVEIPPDDILFEKRYYSIGAVSEMFKENISLIRFWENEFDILKPKKNGKGDRLFRPEDIKNLQLIYHLLREKKYTIEGAKEFLKKNKKSEETFAVIESLKKMKMFFNELKASL